MPTEVDQLPTKNLPPKSPVIDDNNLDEKQLIDNEVKFVSLFLKFWEIRF